MSDFESAIDDFALWEINEFTDAWRDNYAINYIGCYWTAFDNFNVVKAVQDSKDQTLIRLKLDLAVAALTICGGSVLAAVLGEITHMQASGRVFIDALCKANIDEIFKKAKLTSICKVLEYSVGGVWKEIKRIADQEAMRILDVEFIGTNVQQSFIEKPARKEEVMELFLVKNRRNLRAACKALKNSQMSEQDKGCMFNAIKQSNFCNPPKKKVLPSNYDEYIELTFYLKYVLSSDWLIQYNDNAYGFRNGYSKTPIDTAPGSNGYPSSAITYNPGFYTRATTRVEYDKIGQAYIDRMNELYSKLIPGKRFSKLIDSRMCGERTSRQILDRAYQALEVIGHMNRKLIFFPNGGKHMPA